MSVKELTLRRKEKSYHTILVVTLNTSELSAWPYMTN